jgi:hypothetical protein
MKDGTYRVHFSTPHGAVGGGLVKVDQGVIHGADAGFMYSGTAKENGGQVSGMVRVEQHYPGQRSVFGSVQRYEVEFSGISTEGSFHLYGTVVGNPAARVGIVGWLQE